MCVWVQGRPWWPPEPSFHCLCQARLCKHNKWMRVTLCPERVRFWDTEGTKMGGDDEGQAANMQWSCYGDTKSREWQPPEGWARGCQRVAGVGSGSLPAGVLRRLSELQRTIRSLEAEHFGTWGEEGTHVHVWPGRFVLQQKRTQPGKSTTILLLLLLLFWPSPQLVDIPRPGIRPEPQQ